MKPHLRLIHGEWYCADVGQATRRFGRGQTIISAYWDWKSQKDASRPVIPQPPDDIIRPVGFGFSVGTLIMFALIVFLFMRELAK